MIRNKEALIRQVEEDLYARIDKATKQGHNRIHATLTTLTYEIAQLKVELEELRMKSVEHIGIKFE